MTQKIRDKVKDIEDTIHEHFNYTARVRWLCTTIEKLCDLLERLEAVPVDTKTIDDIAAYEAQIALNEWEDEIE